METSCEQSSVFCQVMKKQWWLCEAPSFQFCRSIQVCARHTFLPRPLAPVTRARLGRRYIRCMVPIVFRIQWLSTCRIKTTTCDRSATLKTSCRIKWWQKSTNTIRTLSARFARDAATSAPRAVTSAAPAGIASRNLDTKRKMIHLSIKNFHLSPAF